MSGGETARDESGFTVDTIKVYFEHRLEALDRTYAEQVEQVRREVKAALAASDKAITKQELAAEKRFESVNEFRAQLADQSNTFMPREVADATFAAILSRLNAIENFQAKESGKGVGAADLRVWALAAITFLGGLVVLANYLAR